MIKTPLSTVIGGAFWTPSAMILGGASKTLNQIIKSLFANNEQGFAYDPNDLTTMFQDAAGAVPVTGVGQPVGLIRDKSGRNNHAYQATSASRPILRQNAVTGAYYLAFDGSDDFLQTSNIDFTSTDKVSLFAGVRKNFGYVQVLCELSSNMNFNDRSFYLTAPELETGQYGFKARANAPTHPSMTAITQNTSIDDICVLAASSDLSADRNTIRRNGILSAISRDLGTGNFGNHPFYIGRRAGNEFPFNGHLYSLIGIGRLTSDSETITLEKAIAKNTGVTLNV